MSRSVPRRVWGGTILLVLGRVWGSACTLAYLYLLSIGSTMQSVVPASDKPEGMDWVFFHSGRVGPWLGCLWVIGPSLLVSAGITSMDDDLG